MFAVRVKLIVRQPDVGPEKCTDEFEGGESGVLPGPEAGIGVSPDTSTCH